MRKLLCALALLALNGCAADYLNNYDTMTLASGDSNKQNQLLQTVDPYNPASNNTKIEGDGARSAAVVQKYKQGPGGTAAASSGSAASLPPPPPPE
ncbi:hypothetical protein [Mesorhizobium sp. M00.F.Ca.ET.217.01.1.1]|uniref:hypothetical protein n=1 Tax=Mesorhizobium sp. M00.F.Ca.ET.217.01.1.1 TaxID=2500529 RepID=UPI001FE1DBC7|nr:hypothetical protein [Mesorhizobium sp. M00.F.Ca.ET.217.01.1.1]